MSGDDRARRLAEDQGIPYAEAARRTQLAPADRVRSPGRPWITLNPHIAAVYDWLEANGIHEVLPPDPTVVVGGGVLTFTAFQWWDWQTDRWRLENEQYNGDDPITETRSVPLLVPVPEEVREAARAYADDEDCRFTLVERVPLPGADDDNGD